MRHIILHGHIFKNAGTTFDWSLRQNFGDAFLDHREDQAMLEHGSAHLRQILLDQPALCAISSHHMTRDLPTVAGVKFLPVYFLRHPIVRVRSVYNFERQQQADTPGARAARSKTFRDYVAWRMEEDVRPVIRNYQVRYLAGQHGMQSQGDLAAGHFGNAVAALGSACLVGLVERYDESMLVLEEKLKPCFADLDLRYVAQNVSRTSLQLPDEDSAVASVLGELGPLQKQVIDNNSLDLALYQMARHHLQSQIDQIEDFNGKLRAFRCRPRPQQ